MLRSVVHAEGGVPVAAAMAVEHVLSPDTVEAATTHAAGGA
ncbi:MAG: hypothetical protein ABWY50_04145 [Aeromicrobium sp.]